MSEIVGTHNCLYNRIPLIQRGRGIRPDEAPATLQPVS